MPWIVCVARMRDRERPATGGATGVGRLWIWATG